MLFWKSGGSQAEVRFLTAEGNTVSTRRWHQQLDRSAWRVRNGTA